MRDFAHILSKELNTNIYIYISIYYMKIIFLILSGYNVNGSDRTFDDRFIYDQLMTLSKLYYSKMSEMYDFTYYFYGIYTKYRNRYF
jgi:hypothetical protein